MSLLFWASILACLVVGAAIDTTNVCLVRATSDLTRGKPAMAIGLAVVTAVATAIYFLNTALGWHIGTGIWSYPTWMTLAGAVMFAFGSVLNDACAVGTIGRIARGDLGHLATFAGAAAVAFLLPRTQIVTETPDLPLLTGVSWLYLVLGFTAAVLILGRLHLRLGNLAAYAILGGASAVVTGWQGSWTWLSVFQHLQAGLHIQPAAFFLIGAVVLGAGITAYVKDQFVFVRPNPRLMLLEFVGGGLMVGGAILIPGGNDALTVLGVPSGDPNAVVGYAIMFALMVVMLRMKRMFFSPALA